MKKNILLVFLAVMLVACASWVELTPSGEKTRVLSADEVTSCKKVGTTTAYLRQRVGIVKLNDKKVVHELETLARNSAANMGGDTIVAKGDPQDGKQVYQEFDVYRCINP